MGEGGEQQRIAVVEQAVAEPRPDGPPSTAELATWVEAEVERKGGVDRPRPGLTLTRTLPVLAGWDERSLTGLRRAALVLQLATNRWEIVRDEALLAGLRDGDVRRMRDGLWTYGRLCLGRSLMSHSGYDHSGSCWNVLAALGLGDAALVEEYLPPDTPPSRKGRPTMRTIVNTVVALRHGEHREAAAEQALHAAGMKSSTQYERLLSRYLHALILADRAEAEIALEEITRTWSSTPWLRSWKDPIIKDLGVMLHGFVALGESRLPGIGQVAQGARACSPALAELTGSFGSLPPAVPAITFTGACAPANELFQERPLTDQRPAVRSR